MSRTALAMTTEHNFLGITCAHWHRVTRANFLHAKPLRLCKHRARTFILQRPGPAFSQTFLVATTLNKNDKESVCPYVSASLCQSVLVPLFLPSETALGPLHLWCSLRFILNCALEVPEFKSKVRFSGCDR